MLFAVHTVKGINKKQVSQEQRSAISKAITLFLFWLCVDFFLQTKGFVWKRIGSDSSGQHDIFIHRGGKGQPTAV